MASAHLSTGLLNNLLHVWVWVDGAAGFVCLSGFVLGLSQRARWQRGAGDAAQLWILRRSVQIWLVASGLTTAALLARLRSDDLVFIEDVFSGGRWPSAIVDVLLLQLHIPYFGILGMYVVFLFFAFFAVAALKRHLTVIVLLVSIAVYGLAQLSAARFPPELGTQKFAWSAWQLLFFAGLVAGWHWRDRLHPMARAARSWIIAISTLGIVVFLPIVRAEDIPWLRDIDFELSGHFVKFTLSPATVVYFVFVLAFLAGTIERVRHWRWAVPVLRAVALFGRHSLACFVILSLLQVALWIVATPESPHEAKHVAWFLVALALFALYCLTVEMKPGRRVAQGPGRLAPVAPAARGREGEARSFRDFDRR